MQEYFAKNWKAVFEHNGLRSFDDLWQLKADWFEEPNQRRGGWSGVARCELKQPGGGHVGIFLKRQENHITRTLLHPVRGIATLVREFRNFQRFDLCQVPTAPLVYFAQRRVDGNLRAMLVTEELAGFHSLENVMRAWRKTGRPSLAERGPMIQSIARAVRQMHQHHFRHDCLWSKHIFLKPAGPDKGHPVDARIIDLEKTKRRLFKSSAVLRDLSTLDRDCRFFSRTDRMRFLKAYLQVQNVEKSKKLWRSVAAVSARRTLRKQQKHLKDSPQGS